MRKIKSAKRAALVFISVMLVGILGGCGKSVNAGGCLEARLDNLLKGDTKTVVELNLTLSESTAADAYDEGINAELDALFSSFDVSKELKNDFREIFQNIYANTKYEAGDFTEQEDGSCVVTVTYEQLQVFGPAMEEAEKAYEEMYQGWKDDPSSAPQSDAEMAEQFFILLRGSVKNALVNVKYAEPAKTTITMMKVADQCYVPQRQDLEDLKSKLFDQLDVSKVPGFDVADIYDFDAPAYLQAMLDISYKNDSRLLLQFADISADDASVLYEMRIDAEVEDFLAVTAENISEELENDFRELIKEMLLKARYTVGDAKRQEDGSYIVTVTYEQMKVFEPMTEDFAAKLADWLDNPALIPDSDEEMVEQLLIMERDSLQKVLMDVEYKEPEEMTITLIPHGESYMMNINDSLILEKNLFDSEVLYGAQ